VPTKVEPPRAGPATIIPFPVVRRRDFIARAANTHERYNSKGAKNYLTHLIERHADRLARLGVAPDLADADVLSLRVAVGMADEATS
jgi:hypothetical protein